MELWKSLRDLNYRNTLQLCTSNEKYEGILNDPKFWNYKISHQYPEANINLSISLHDNYIIIENFYNPYEQDMEYNGLQDEIKVINKLIENMKLEMNNISIKAKEIRDRYIQSSKYRYVPITVN